MSAAPMLSVFGGDLTPEDYAALEARWIPRGLADEAGIRRVDSITGRAMFSRKGGDMSGLIIPNILPGESYVREYRERLDHPDLERGSDGGLREINKYLQPPGRKNLVYFPPGLPESALQDTTIPVVATEGEFKALALYRAAMHNSDSLRFVPLGLAGVWNFRGTVGKATDQNGQRRDVKGVISDLDRIAWKGRRVIIAYDADAENKPQVRAARWKLSSVLQDRGAQVGFLEWPIGEGKGIDDRLALVGPERVLADIAAVEFGDWQTKLIRNDQGKLIACHENASLLLERSPEWAGILAYNEFTAAHVILKRPPEPVSAEVGCEIEDHFDTEVVRWLERKGVMVKPDTVRRVVDAVARQNSHHPVRDYLESLRWDGTPRIETWLIDYCGVDSSDANPNRYAMAVGEKFLISAVARVMQPGCKADHILILEGQQGIGKSTAVKILAGEEWFTDQLSDMGSKDASMQLRGVWLVELGELDVLNRSEMARVKAFLSQQVERFRLPYGHRIVKAPRQCCFVGTINADTWLKDETGGRRFWPVRCRKPIDLNGLKRDRDQLWAEALHRFRADATWWLDDAEVIQDAIEEQKSRYEADIWQEQIAKWLSDPRERMDEQGHPVAAFSSTTESVTVADVLAHCIGKRMDMWTQVDKNRVSRCLTALGWERFKAGAREERSWRYRPKNEEAKA